LIATFVGSQNDSGRSCISWNVSWSDLLYILGTSLTLIIWYIPIAVVFGPWATALAGAGWIFIKVLSLPLRWPDFWLSSAIIISGGLIGGAYCMFILLGLYRFGSDGSQSAWAILTNPLLETFIFASVAAGAFGGFLLSREARVIRRNSLNQNRLQERISKPLLPVA
jgi:hypothetical protein